MQKRIEDWIVELRRDFHRFPETAFNETRTAEKIASVLAELGLEVQTGFGGTGLAGVIRGKRPGRIIGLRADMDALAIREKTDLEFKSQIDGVMHACGHDAHMAVMLGVAGNIVQNKMHERFEGGVKFIFQPAEEGVRGARAMIEDGVLEDPRVDTVLACHVTNDLPCGEVGVYENVSNALSDRFSVLVRAEGGHAAHPDKTSDAILAACFYVTQIQSVVARNVDPTMPAVVSVGVIHGGSAANILPEEVSLRGTVRAFDGNVRELVKGRLEDIALALKRSFALEEVDFDYSYGCPPCVNSAEAVSLLKSASGKTVGGDKVRLMRPGMGAEDLAFFAEKRPTALLRLGTRNPNGGRCGPAHSPFFEIDERALMIGVKIFSAAVEEYLSPGGQCAD